MKISKTHEAWHQDVHAVHFDVWHKLSLRELKKTYQSFNEIRLFLENKSFIKGKTLVEIGCATGELYRYMKAFHPEFQYSGFDISEPAIRRAKEKYPHGDFSVCKEDLSDIIGQNLSPSVVLERNIVAHQPNAFEFLSKIISIPTEVAIFRLRTRDKGETVLDPDLSCMWHYSKWVPYIVMNIDECIEKIKQTVNFEALFIVKNYQQLGGHNSRFLPKECYYPETGTAETAVYVQLANSKVSNPKIVISERADSNPHFTLFEIALRIIRNRIFKK